MAAPRLTKEQVHLTAADLDREGKKPTAANVRDRLGSGSFTTILKHLMDYEGPDSADGPESIPEAPAAAIAAVWAAAYTAAWKIYDEQLRRVENAADDKLQAVQSLEDLTNDLDRRLTLAQQQLLATGEELNSTKEERDRSTADMEARLRQAEGRLAAVTEERDRLFRALEGRLTVNDSSKDNDIVTPTLPMNKPRWLDPEGTGEPWTGTGNKMPRWVVGGMRAKGLDPRKIEDRSSYKLELVTSAT